MSPENLVDGRIQPRESCHSAASGNRSRLLPLDERGVVSWAVDNDRACLRATPSGPARAQ